MTYKDSDTLPYIAISVGSVVVLIGLIFCAFIDPWSALYFSLAAYMVWQTVETKIILIRIACFIMACIDIVFAIFKLIN